MKKSEYSKGVLEQFQLEYGQACGASYIADGLKCHKGVINRELQDKLKDGYPFASGGFSDVYDIDGLVVKVQEEGDLADTMREMKLQNIAADAGLAPKAYDVKQVGNDVLSTQDRVPKGFKSASIEPEMFELLPKPMQDAGGKLYADLLKAGVVHKDFHTGNWFVNADGKGMAIDFGIANTLKDANMKQLVYAAQRLEPVLRGTKMGARFEKMFNKYDPGTDWEENGPFAQELRTLLPQVADSL